MVKILIIILLLSFTNASFSQTNNLTGQSNNLTSQSNNLTSQSNNLTMYITGVTWNSYIDTNNSFTIFDFTGNLVVNNPNQQNVSIVFHNPCGLIINISYLGAYHVSYIPPNICTKFMAMIQLKPGNNTFSSDGKIKVTGYTHNTLPDGSYYIKEVEDPAISTDLGLTINVKNGAISTIFGTTTGGGFLDFPILSFILMLTLIPILKMKRKHMS